MATLLYGVNFAALANQTLSAGGAHVVDGRTWYAKGNLVQGGNTYSRNLVSGQGLSLLTMNTGATVPGTAGDLDYPHWFLPLTQVPDFTAAESHLIRARFKIQAGTTYAYLGLVDSTNDGTGLRAAVRAKDHLVSPLATLTTTSSLRVKKGTAADVSLLARAGTIANVECVVGIHYRAAGNWEFTGSEHLVSGMPASVDTFLPAGPSASPDVFFDPATRANAGIFFGLQNQLGQAHGVYLQRLEIWRMSAVPVVPDTTAPVVDSFVPAPGNIGRQQVQQFDAHDNAGLAGCVVMVRYGLVPPSTKRAYDVVYDGVEFADYYKGRSSIEVISPTHWRFRTLRDGGWPTPPRFALFAADGRVAA